MESLANELVGKCAFCENHNHEFPDDSWHEMKHFAGWHGCDVYGGFRFCRPKCDKWELGEDAMFLGVN